VSVLLHVPQQRVCVGVSVMRGTAFSCYRFVGMRLAALQSGCACDGRRAFAFCVVFELLSVSMVFGSDVDGVLSSRHWQIGIQSLFRTRR